MGTDYTLAYGTHSTPEEGRCAMEWVSHLAGEPHSDDPACVSPVLRAYCTSLNDTLEDGPRQHLRPYLARTIGTADDGLDEARSWMALDWLIRTYAPTWLAAAGLTESAHELKDVAPVMDASDLRGAIVVLKAARREARTRWSNALGAARPAAWAPWAAGRSAAREAAWRSAGAAAWAAARVAVGDIAGDRARAIARDIAGDAAATTARAARTATGRAAAREVTRSALAPTLDALQRSAFALLDRMLPTMPLGAAVAGDTDLCDVERLIAPPS
ncbi:MAG: hypothetical protein ACXVW5_21115 [Solirubrobacteraceae bacterium]